MDEFIQHIFSKGPVWVNIVFAGTLVGLTIFIIANRTYVKQLRASYEERINASTEAHGEQIKLKDDTIDMLQRAKQESQLLLQEAAKDALKERDVYRDRLHEEKANHQATLLRLTEVESRPDLGRILSSVADFNQQMLNGIKALELEMKKHSSLCNRSIKLMDVIVTTLVEKKILTKDQVSTIDA